MGALLISAAGNDGLNTTDYFPANCKGVLAVAGSTRRGGAPGTIITVLILQWRLPVGMRGTQS